MNYSNKEIKRAIRDFERKVNNLVSAKSRIYKTRVNEFINLIKNNEIINSIVGSYLTLEVDFEEIENPKSGSFFNFKLPNNEDLQIAYALQVMELATEGKRDITGFAFSIFRHKRLTII